MSAASEPIPGRIFTVRGHRVIMDADLARLYGVATSRLNEAVKRNSRKFPADFLFQLTTEESAAMAASRTSADSQHDAFQPPAADSSQIAMSSSQVSSGSMDYGSRSQFATDSRAKHRGAAYRPWVFTEHGALMAANILRSPRATEMAIYVVRAFVKQREALAANATILKRLAEIDRSLLEHDEALKILWQRLRPLLAPPPEKPKRRIGFHQGDR